MSELASSLSQDPEKPQAVPGGQEVPRRNAKVTAASEDLVGREATPEEQTAKYLAYAEQLPPDRPNYIIGVGDMGLWTVDLLRRRDMAVAGYISDQPGFPDDLEGFPVLPLETLDDLASVDGNIIVASVARDEILKRIGGGSALSLWDATELYQFVTSFVAQDKSGILVDDLGLTYDRISKEDARKYGEVWRRIPRLPIHRYVRNIEAAFGRGSRYVVNIGCHDGITGDPCYPLYRDGWGGWAIDGLDPSETVAQLAQKNLNLPGVQLTLGTYVTPTNIVGLLQQHNAPLDCDLIKVDIDSIDGAVIQAILENGWRPRVFCVEVNADIPPPFKFIADCSPDYDAVEYDYSSGLYGCSVAWAADIFTKCGYRFARYEFGFPHLIGGVRDMVLIRSDMFEGSGAIPASWEDAYYAEPLGWSHMRAGLKLDTRIWRHSSPPPTGCPSS